MKAASHELDLPTLSKSFLSAVFVLSLCGAGSLPAQTQPAAPGNAQQQPEIKEFQGYEDQWSTAVVKADQYTMEYLLSPMYVDISATGDVNTRNQLIAQLFEKGASPLSLEQRVVSVREFGDTALVSGTYIVKLRVDGRNREERGIFTHVYERAHGHWACVNAQRTAVVELAPGAKQKTQAKSDASEPFHIPLFHKGADPTEAAAAAAPGPRN